MKQIGIQNALYITQEHQYELVFNMAKAEGNSLTFEEASKVIQGISVGGKRMSELHQIEHIKSGWDCVIDLVRRNAVHLCKEMFIYLNSIVAEGENAHPGDFRQKQVLISGTTYIPPVPHSLPTTFQQMLQQYEEDSIVDEKIAAMDLFLDTARHQFFLDGNKRTGQLVMNAVLISKGYAPFTFAPEDDAEFRKLLIHFYETGEKTGMRQFIVNQITKLQSY